MPQAQTLFRELTALPLALQLNDEGSAVANTT